MFDDMDCSQHGRKLKAGVSVSPQNDLGNHDCQDDDRMHCTPRSVLLVPEERLKES